MALTPQEQKIYDRLQLRHLQSRHAKSGVVQPAPKPDTQIKDLTAAVVKALETKPEINVTVEAPPEATEPAASKRWTFKHKYDHHGNLTETIATAD